MPGSSVSNTMAGFPWFFVTAHGRRLLQDREYVPHDRQGYLQLLHERVPTPDATVLAYLSESLETYARNNLVASTVMLGVAAERVFDLVCTSVLESLADTAEQKSFSVVLGRNPMKQKLDWLQDKLRRVQQLKPGVIALPENVTLTITAIYDLLRVQRNEFGHPSDARPQPSRAQAYANLLIFPPYYERAEALRQVLTSNAI